MDRRLNIINYSNAFFGAFFGFWSKSILDPLLEVTAGDWFEVILVTLSIMLAVSLHIAGLWRSRNLFYTTEVGKAFKLYALNFSSVIIFSAIMGVIAYCYKSVQSANVFQFSATFGVMLYTWWVVGTFLVLILAKPEEGKI